MERDLVDSRFSALREIVTGQADGPGAAAAPAAGKSGLESITGLINEYYTVLVIADTALAGSSLPPAGVDLAAKLKLESGKLPAPFKETLVTIAISGADKVAVGAASVLKVQAQAQLDRLVGLMASLVSEPCKRSIEGRYPFASSNQEVAIEDFNAVFATGGLADDYFSKYLLPLVDTSTKPWRYKNPSTANAMVGIESTTAQPAPATTGPTLQGELLKLLIQGGPNPEHFYKIAQIRESFFREGGGKRMAWKMDLKVTEMDATITELLIDIDGQTQRYAHGPVQTLSVTWPGPRGGVVSEISASPRVRPDTSTALSKGPWAILRLLERSKVGGTASGSKSVFDFSFDNRKVALDITTAGGGVSPFTGELLKGFRCPARI
jgi:type VI secretion system protein ImpL